jgi:hypothetical protein
MSTLEVYVSPKLGAEADAVLRLIQCKIPEHSKERDNMIEGISQRLATIHESHYQARKIIYDYTQRHHQFGLFLRNFGLEERQQVIDAHSHMFESWIRRMSGINGLSLMTLRGGSDALFGAKPVFSTVSDNWLPIADELIAAAKFIVILAGDLSAGLKEEIELIRAHKRQNRCVVAITEKGTPTIASFQLTRNGVPYGSVIRLTDDEQKNVTVEELRFFFKDFPHTFDFNPQHRQGNEEDYYSDWPGEGRLRTFVTDAFSTHIDLPHAIEAPCQYVDPEVKKSESYVESVDVLRRALGLLENELNRHKVELSGMAPQRLSWDRIAEEKMWGWVGGHFCYGLSVAVEDYRSMIQSLRYLARFHTYILRDPNSGGYHLVIARNIAALVDMKDEMEQISEEHATHSKLFWTLEENAPLLRMLKNKKADE